ncbi:Polyphosphate kinase [Planctomycetales bacterium 10988]|nr:Polyphosphate kinase [Planctomycetales bacterium 10988]
MDASKSNTPLHVSTSQSFLPEHFINRELSWLEFNARVLEEAKDSSNPLLERVKFLAITSSNLDEFFMVRIAGLREQTFGDGAPQDHAPDGMGCREQMSEVARRTQAQVAEQYACWNEVLKPCLAEEGIQILRPDQLNSSQTEWLESYFQERIFPVLTPMAIDPSHPSPLFHNRNLYLATILEREAGGIGPRRLFAVVQLPSVLPRLIQVKPPQHHFVLLEEVIASKLQLLFGSCRVVSWTTFRITRDSDLEVLEQEADDLLQLIEDRLKARRRGDAVRLEVNAGASDEIVRQIVESEGLHDDSKYQEVYRVPGMVDLTALWQVVKLPGFHHLREVPFSPRSLREMTNRASGNLFDIMRKRDLLLHHPFDSFDPVVEFIQRAADDPQVLAIKQTLYRTGGADSPIVRALIEAAENGKHVTALVELKARFDEETNVGWAREMERAGVHVIFGFLDLKTHCKVALVVRKEKEGLRRYVHLSTGNYNPITARLYTDMGLFTSDPKFGEDASALFNLLTGYSDGHPWQRLTPAPMNLHQQTIDLIEEQTSRAQRGKTAWIFAKINSLVDHKVIEALYRASQAGVKIDLVIRGVCCLRPGLPGISDNIHVRSVVDRYLEHTRFFIFGPEAEAKIFLSSADWMPRNFFRRVEVMFPILDPDIKQRILQQIVPIYMRDNVKARLLESDGTHCRATCQEEETPHRSQKELMEMVQPIAEEEAPEPERRAARAILFAQRKQRRNASA